MGYVYEIIAEDCAQGYTCGYTGNYIRVYVKGTLAAGGRYRVKLKQLYKDGVIAEADE